MGEFIYLDNSATTPICEEALKKYCEVAGECFGNPSSLHKMGYEAEKELEQAKRTILSSIGADSSRLVFTSSGSEANNLAIIGRALSKERYKGAKIISTMGEHASVYEPMEKLRSMGFKIAYIPTLGGKIDFEALERELTRDVILISIMMVNNETGAVYDIPRVARAVKAKCSEALVHVDATQGYMKIPFTKKAIGADLITLSSHKIEGPKGVGALVIDEDVIVKKGLAPLILGGGQQMGLRSGTENVPGIAAFGEAVRVGTGKLKESISHMSELREYLISKLASSDGLKEIKVTDPEHHAPHILNITLPNIKSETMLHFLSSSGIFISSGSACSSNTGHLSSALTSYGHTREEADCSVRISLSPRNTKQHLDALCSALEVGLEKLARIKK